LVNNAIQKIGMGDFQRALFALADFGWMFDQFWQTTASNALGQASLEFNIKHSAFQSLALIAGRFVGATFWVLGSDLNGRKIAFNTPVFIAAVFGIAAGAVPTFVSYAVLISFFGFVSGGN
ncbi:hypothetical protein BJ878DRAFT_394508, partial [Calycina marina]